MKSTLERLNVPGKPKMKLGPTPEFTANLNQFKRWRNDVSSDVIPIKNENEVHTVEVTFNGLGRTRQVIKIDSGQSEHGLPDGGTGRAVKDGSIGQG